LIAVAALGVAIGSAGCGGSGGEQIAAASISHPRSRIAEEQPPSPKHLDVATKAQERSSARRIAAEEAPAPPKPPPGDPNAPAAEWMPPASAGTNGSYKPGSSSGRSITPRTIERLDREEAEGRAVLLGGIALAPPSAPEAVKAMVSGANEIVGRPYVWGGGHASWYSAGYDCSGAVSYALAAGGFLAAPLASGQLASWGAPGAGKWVTVYANAGHAYAVVAGLRWDTVGDARGSGPRWHAAAPYPEGFVARHPPGY
jgi:cell wall-associated NlpC family hydrolase